MSDHLPARFLVSLAQLQARRPFLVLLIGLLTLIPSLFFTLRLGFKPDFAELLPDHKDSVIEMRRVSKRLPGITSLTVTAEIADGKNEAALVQFVDTIVPKLEALGQPWVERVEWGSHDILPSFLVLLSKRNQAQPTPPTSEIPTGGAAPT